LNKQNVHAGATSGSNFWSQGEQSSHFSRGGDTHQLLPTIRETAMEEESKRGLRKEWMPARYSPPNGPVVTNQTEEEEDIHKVTRHTSLRNRVTAQMLAQPVGSRSEERAIGAVQ